MLIDIISLFPQYFRGPFDESMIKRAREKQLVEINLVDLREYAEGKHRQVDDRPYGGGPGMVLMAPPLLKAIRATKKKKSRVIYLSPQGKLLTAEKCRELAKEEQLILLAGHYEGIDQRVIDAEVDEEISIGDYVLTNGCLPAIVLVDALLRFVPGVIGHEEAVEQDSFQQGLLDWPHFTRPREYEGKEVPKVLLDGNHAEIENWRKKKAMEKTEAVRPDLLAKNQSEE